jgi:hypothetical protein
MRSCCCTGYLTNPGGVCCMDLTRTPTVTTTATTSLPTFTEERWRQIIREEIERARTRSS